MEIGNKDNMRKFLYYSLTQEKFSWENKVGETSIAQVSFHEFFAVFSSEDYNI
jgi:hypothetical protein